MTALEGQWSEEDGWHSGKAKYLGYTKCGPIAIANLLNSELHHEPENREESYGTWYTLPIIRDVGQISFIYEGIQYKEVSEIYVNYDAHSKLSIQVIDNLLCKIGCCVISE